MPALLDINVLLALADGQHADHSKAREWLETISADRQIALCRIVQMGFLRLLNNPSVMGPAVRTGSAAWAIWDKILSDDRFFWVDEPTGFEEAFRRLTKSFASSPKRWPDAYLAAFADAASLELVTFDSGFRSFKGFRLLT
jgi:toxin-antitoxin system PIN domain toxin